MEERYYTVPWHPELRRYKEIPGKAIQLCLLIPIAVDKIGDVGGADEIMAHLCQLFQPVKPTTIRDAIRMAFCLGILVAGSDPTLN